MIEIFYMGPLGKSGLTEDLDYTSRIEIKAYIKQLARGCPSLGTNERLSLIDRSFGDIIDISGLPEDLRAKVYDKLAEEVENTQRREQDG